jgi:RHS repeat-associated protein
LDTGLSRIIATKEGTNSSDNYLYGSRGELLSKSDGTTTRHYLSDHQNSIIGEIDDNGSWLGSRAYSPYGVKMVDTISDLPFGFNGEYTSDHNVQYLRARSYLTNLAMFAQIDAFKGDMGSPNSQQRFSYGEGNPISNSDPTGNQVERAPIPPLEGFRPITPEDLGEKRGRGFPNIQIPWFQDNRDELGPLLESGRRERASVAGHGFFYPTPDIAECNTVEMNNEFQRMSILRTVPKKFAEFLNAFTCGSKLFGDPDEYFTVPDDTTLVFGVPPMGMLSDEQLGPVFDRCEDDILNYRTLVIHANTPAPNILVKPPVGLTINRDGPWPVYTTDVEDGVRLSDLIEQNNLAGKIICVSACQEATGAEGSGFIYPQTFGAFNTRLDTPAGSPVALCENEECERSFREVACRYGYCELDEDGNVDRGQWNYPEFGN